MRMSTEPGYASPAVTVASSLPRRAAASTVLIVPVVSTGDDDKPGAAVTAAEPFLSSDAVAEIESGLRALEATGGADQVHRLVVGPLPVSSVLTIGLGKPRPQWPADTVRRAAGVAARSLGTTEAVLTTLGELPGT
ncbi:M17 family peptidase N-terminal domain-containing protein, partial [Mycobacterium intracellulare]|uniref:M17 family peptidase N-terminal domain-containing protein n=1 Tax=Mycobacterium intracellulare TaxID=1767 RepID=UPI0024165BE9